MATNGCNMASKANHQTRYEALTLHGFCAILLVMPRLLFILQLFIKYLLFYLHITIIRIIFVE